MPDLIFTPQAYNENIEGLTTDKKINKLKFWKSLSNIRIYSVMALRQEQVNQNRLNI